MIGSIASLLLIFMQGVANLDGLRLRLCDADGQVVGRFASQIAQILMGKDKPTYCPEKDDGDVVVVVNAEKIEFTGRKWDKKLYQWHTGYPGGLKERTAKDQLAREPADVLRKAVMGMLPKNNLRRSMARKLRIFAGNDHEFVGHPALVVHQMPPRTLRDKGDVFVAPEGFEPFNPEVYWKKLKRMEESTKIKDARKNGSE